MEDKNCELLFEYLRSILYDSHIQTLDVHLLDKPYQKLGMGLQYLEKSVRELKKYTAELSTGKLSGSIPGKANFLCANLKNLHANLNHLTWQAKQVAKGDYSQTVSYLGEFSDAFNSMTQQLREREALLMREAEIEKNHANIVESYNQLLMELIHRSKEDVLVTSMKDQSILYCSQSKDNSSSFELPEIYEICLEQTRQRAETGLLSEEDSYEWTWETEDSYERVYRITTGRIEWQGQSAYTHIIHEITNEKRREELLEVEAHQDTLTKIGNRFFFEEKAEELLQTEEGLIFCYCDLDHLKHINDRYGHMEGDWYLTHFTETVNNHIRKEDIFARVGGDEFCIILRKCPRKMAEEKMQKIQMVFSSDRSRKYAKSFSCGIVEIPENHPPMQVEDVIRQADSIMYQQKRQHKEVYFSQL